MDCREVLQEALLGPYTNELITNGWQIMEQPWHATTDELRNHEPMICSKIYLKQQIKSLASGGGGDGGGKNGRGKHRHNQRQNKGGGGGNGNDKNRKGGGNSNDPHGNENSPYCDCG